MKILMIAPQPFMQPRGTPISVYQRLLALASLGFQVDLLTYHLGEDVDIPGVAIHRIPNIPFIRSIKIGPSLGKLFLDPLLIIHLIWMLIKNRYYVIHSHEEASFFAAPIAKLFGVKHLYDMHSSLPNQLRNYKSWNNFLLIKICKILEAMVMRSSDAIITVGTDLYDFVKQKYPDANTVLIDNLPLQSTVVVSGPSEIEGIERRLSLNGKHTVLYTGTFEPYQGLDMLIKSAGIIVGECPDIQFLLVGGTKDQVNHYRNLASERSVSDFFHFTGNVSTSEAIGYLDLASIIVSPRLEGNSIPLKAYTYLLSGKPLVATDITAHKPLMSEDVAVLVAPNAEAFAQGILKLVHNPQLGMDLARRAQEFMWDNHGFDDYLKKVESIYAGLATKQNVEVSADATH
jgi:glycosyltransferase involved in cell wall biosynthesis